MANRSTRQAAEQLKSQLSGKFPSARLAIIETETECQVHPAALDAQNLHDQVVRWEDHPSGHKYPVVSGKSFEILEEKVCPFCGETFLTAAIGELVAHSKCENAQRDQRSDAEVQADTAEYLSQLDHAEKWND